MARSTVSRMTSPRRRSRSSRSNSRTRSSASSSILDVAVAQHPAHARVVDPESGKQPADERADDLLHGDEAGRFTRELDEPRDPLGDGDESEHRILAVAGASHHEAEAEVGDEREGMRRIARDRGEDGKHLLHEVLVEPDPFLVTELRLVEHVDSRLAHLGHQRLPAVLLLVHQGVSAVGDRGELLGRGHPVLARHRDAGLHLAVEARDPDHVELVEVGGGDGEEPHPFQKRHPRVPRFLEHPFVEREPGELAVDEALGRVGSDGREGGGQGASCSDGRGWGAKTLRCGRSLLRLREFRPGPRRVR